MHRHRHPGGTYVNMFEILKETSDSIPEQIMGDIYLKAYGSRNDPNDLSNIL